jgi:hypothetical protein
MRNARKIFEFLKIFRIYRLFGPALATTEPQSAATSPVSLDEFYGDPLGGCWSWEW